MEREQFGQAIGQFQMNQDLIAQMVSDIESARLMVYKAAWQKDRGNLRDTGAEFLKPGEMFGI